MKNKKQIVIFGGCFNPPLNSHFSLAEQVLNEFEIIEKILFVPVGIKYPKPNLASNEHRYNMLKLVCNKNDKFDVSSFEQDCAHTLTTIETLTEMQKLYPEYDIGFIMGSDNLKELDTWDDFEKLITNFKLYILERDKDNIDEIIKNNINLKNYQSYFIKSTENIVSNLSSTYVRDKIRDNKSVKYLIPDEVINYIKKNRLYTN